MKKSIIIFCTIFLFFISLSSICANNSTDNSEIIFNSSDDVNLEEEISVSNSLSDIPNTVNKNGYMDDLNIDDWGIVYSNNIRNFNDDLNIDDFEIVYSNNIRNPTTIFIDESSYDSYFYKFTGEIKEDADIISGDTLKIGNVTNKAFVVDRKLTLTSISGNDTINNGVIHLIEGSDESTVTGLRIINTQATVLVNGVTGPRLHGIWLTKTNNNIISHNFVRIANAAGVYGMPMGWSSNNTIVYNDIKTYITTCMPMGDCHNNNISYNSMETLDYSISSVTNVIYYNPFGHADYGGSGICYNNTISNNYLKCYGTGEMAVVLMLRGNSHNTSIINNTILRGITGISISAENITIYGNKLSESSINMAINGKNIIISNNTISDNYNERCIVVSSNEGVVNPNISVCNNTISITNGTNFGISASGQGINIFNNLIKMGNYGTGIYISGNKSLVFNNRIYCVSDKGISFAGDYQIIKNNIIHTKDRGIVINSPTIRYYNNTIAGNTIFSDSYGISIEGLVYYTTISDNIIETNATVGIYKDIADEIADNDSDNMINGIIYDATALIINDTNFYKYFDNKGYLKYSFKEGKIPTIFFTYLSHKNVYFTDKINIISNKMANLLLNVTIYLSGNASGSIVRDFIFYNNGKNGIVLDGVDDVLVSNNNFTILSTSIQSSIYGILVQGVCEKVIISSNQIYINSKSSSAYGIGILASRVSNDFSCDFTISNNNVIIVASGIAEALYTDGLVDSTISFNSFNIISESFAYGIATGNTIGRQFGLNIVNNSIVIYSTSMVYLIELHMSDNCFIEGNYLWGDGSGVYGIATYMSNNISIKSNELFIFGGKLSDIGYNGDVLGNGHAAIFISRFNNGINISSNLIYTNISKQIIINDYNSIVNLSHNIYIIDDFNYMNYFDNEGRLLEGVLLENDVILFNNVTIGYLMEINIPLNISFYKNNNFNGILKLVDGSNNSNITGLMFNDGSLILLNVFNVNIFCNSFLSSYVELIGTFNVSLYLNNFTFENSSGISLSIVNSNLTSVIDNYFLFNNSFSSNGILLDKSFDTKISNNVFKGYGEKIIFIKSLNSKYNNIFNNTVFLNGFSIYAYHAFNTHYDSVKDNSIFLNGTSLVTNQSGIYYYSGSSNNHIFNNHIVSYSVSGGDYAIVILEYENLFNQIIGNYLISDNGLLFADYAVYAVYALIRDNVPIYIYVSVDGSDIDGDGSELKPYKTLNFAINSSLNKSIIILLKGVYKENNLFIDKNITITANNTNGDVFIDVEGKQLFNISSSVCLTINALKIYNSHSVEGGSLFINNGVLIINNSILYNNTAFCTDHSHDCGYGGVILNYGELLINSSTFYNNLAHKGGVLADFGKTSIINSLFYNNYATNGAVIFTDTKNELNIVKSVFFNNTALTTLDFCVISRGPNGEYGTACCNYIGAGGVIYSNSPIVIDNSLFEYNCAYRGGVIAQYSSFGEYSNYKPQASLMITNSVFDFNKAMDTSYGNLTMLTYGNTYYSGGAIYGTLYSCTILNSSFNGNAAGNSGGALHIESQDGVIDGSVFTYNVAGDTGGALALAGNFLFTNNIITNNSASYSGGLHYSSYSTYGHMLNNLNIFNSTITGNIALKRGGALGVTGGNVTISNSNIFDNFAPAGNTFYASSAYIDARNNWWGSIVGPDDSVWNYANYHKEWLNSPVNWLPNVKIPKENNTGDNGSDNGNGSGTGQQHGSFIPGTGGSTGTGSSLGGSGDGTGDGSGGGSGLNDGNQNNMPGSGNLNGSIVLPGGFFSNTDGSGVIRTDVVSLNSLSRSNSSNVLNLLGVGLIINAADASSSSDSSGTGSGSSSAGDSGSSVYEISEVIKKNILKDPLSVYTIIIILIILFVLLFLGFKRQNRDN
ncbi:MAG: right-handed parallel beta-helix repeat-containing protein [Methanobacteriaceae archaeon]|nr:right-handed parallel beta-helix repeat-containing protein [Methanobacteriaceae archaeon]